MCKHYIKFRTEENVADVICQWNLHLVDQFKVKVSHDADGYVEGVNEFVFVMSTSDGIASTYLDFVRERWDERPEWYRVNNDFNIGDDIECTEMLAND